MTTDNSQPRKIRVAVVFGGRSDEHDVSLRSARTIMDALDPARYDIVPIGITRSGQWLAGDDPHAALVAESPMFHLTAGENTAVPTSDWKIEPVIGAEALPPQYAAEGIDVFFPALHGPMGEDGTLQGMLELAGVPYVGSGVLGSAVSMDKAMTKVVLEQAGVPQLPWMLVTRREWQQNPDAVISRIEASLPYPVFVKPANMGSSVGVSKSKSAADLRTALQEAAHFDRRIVIEQGVVGRELEMGVLGNEAPITSGLGEIRPRGEFYDYASKYLDDSAELIIPADVDPAVQTEMERIAVDAFIALDLAGLARVDFFLENDTNQIYLNEVNTLPGFTSISMYPMLWEQAGISLPELVNRLLELALERHLH
ncbi:MAG: D-alanine--D-alanine ligase [Thermomicrobiales bacterium]|nr:D-alanine--D-alanine ligase [Thermomicrobiales bacterium]